VPQQPVRSFLFAALIASSPFVNLVSVSLTTNAQVVPDSSLGNEQSILRSGIQNERGLIDRIDGGARRGGNLIAFLTLMSIRGNEFISLTPPTLATLLAGSLAETFPISMAPWVF
jgi:hypothetical protein